MSPATQSAGVPAVMAKATEKLLGDDELIILAIKPSGWFVLMVSWPVLAVVAVTAVGVGIAGKAMPDALPDDAIYLLCLIVATARLVIACGQWTARLYMLTSRRIMSVYGVIKVRLNECALDQISTSDLTVTPVQKLLRLGSLTFHDADREMIDLAWMHLSQSGEVKELVDETIRRAKIVNRKT